MAAAPVAWLSQHRNRWSAHSGAMVKVDQRPQELPRHHGRFRPGQDISSKSGYCLGYAELGGAGNSVAI